MPTDEELLAFYATWFEENYCTKPVKPSLALLGFAKAVLERYGTTQVELPVAS